MTGFCQLPMLMVIFKVILKIEYEPHLQVYFFDLFHDFSDLILLNGKSDKQWNKMVASLASQSTSVNIRVLSINSMKFL